MIFKKILDFMDASVGMVILMDNVDQFSVMVETIVSIDKNRCSYRLYKNSISDFVMELRLPRNRYKALIKELRRRGWSLKSETPADVIVTMIEE